MTIKIKTGIEGLDKILSGGLQEASSLLVTGAPGTGKTIMALQFIYNGAKLSNDPGIFITAEEGLDYIRDMALALGMDFEAYEKKGKITLIEKPVIYLKGGIASIQGLIELIRQKKVKRVALDSLTFFEYIYQGTSRNEIEFRRQVLLFIQEMKKCNVTFMAVAERKNTDLDNFQYEMMDFLFEGFILLSRIRKGSFFERVLSVIKMRGQEHSLDIYPISIGKEGLKILTDTTPFSLVESEGREKSKK